MPTAHPWHELLPGPEVPAVVRAVIEIPRGSRCKYELDKPSGLLVLDRVLHSAMRYPANYGLIPQTYYLDHDPLDILVLCAEDLVPLATVPARVIGLLHMQDTGLPDDKIIAVADRDPTFASLTDVAELPAAVREEIQDFFAQYKRLENKPVTTLGFAGRAAALACVQESLARYQQQILPTLPRAAQP